MNRIAGLALTTAFLFLIVVAIMLNSPSLFYMGTALLAMIGASRIQALLAVRSLHFERRSPKSVHVGEMVTVEVTAWSNHRIKRPLLLIHDLLPPRLTYSDRSFTLPIAPAFDIPIQTRYQFRALRRGVFRWSQLRAIGTDALGLTNAEKTYQTDPCELTVLPIPISLKVEIPQAISWGESESDQGTSKGPGIEIRGIRDYVHGDSLRNVHWRSSAKAGKLLVKEFDTGSFARAAFFLQLQQGTDVGSGANTTLERIIGNALALSNSFMRQGIWVDFPVQGIAGGGDSVSVRNDKICAGLAQTEANSQRGIASDLRSQVSSIPEGTTIYLFASCQDTDLVSAVRETTVAGHPVIALLYDSTAFDKSKAEVSAANPDYVLHLRQAGAAVIVIPNDK